MTIAPWIRESNLLENVDDPREDARSARAFAWLLNEPRLTLQTICDLHRKVMWQLDRRIAGHLRDCRVFIGDGEGSPPGEVIYDLSYWLREWGCAATDADIKQAHVLYEKIHPFADGNGRTGRMVMNWQRVKAGLEPLCIEASERQDYYAWFVARRTKAGP